MHQPASASYEFVAAHLNTWPDKIARFARFYCVFHFDVCNKQSRQFVVAQCFRFEAHPQIRAIPRHEKYSWNEKKNWPKSFAEHARYVYDHTY